MHAAAYALNPYYRNIISDIMRKPKVAVGIKYVVERLSTSPEETAAMLSDLVDYQFGLDQLVLRSSNASADSLTHMTHISTCDPCDKSSKKRLVLHPRHVRPCADALQCCSR